MKCSGDDHWFPCAVHFAQLAMREAVQEYLSTSKSSDSEECEPENATDE